MKTSVGAAVLPCLLAVSVNGQLFTDSGSKYQPLDYYGIFDTSNRYRSPPTPPVYTTSSYPGYRGGSSGRPGYQGTSSVYPNFRDSRYDTSRRDDIVAPIPPPLPPSSYKRPRSDSYGYGHETSYGYDQPSYGYDYQSYGGYEQPSYGYEQSSYGGHEQPSYSYVHKDECEGLETISLILGLGALAAFFLFFYLQQQAAAAARGGMMRREFSATPDQPLESNVSWMLQPGALWTLDRLEQGETGRGQVSEALDRLRDRYTEPAVVEKVMTATCRGLDLLETRQRRRQARQVAGDCLEGLIGPLAGFFALGAIVAYALAQAATAAAARGFRSNEELQAESAALNSAALLLVKSLDDRRTTCVTSDLCQVTREADTAPGTVQTVIKLASVATAWYAARLHGHPYQPLCWSLVQGLRNNCTTATHSTCTTANRHPAVHPARALREKRVT